jgi:hypothetical protein
MVNDLLFVLALKLLREYRKFFDNFENGGEKAEAREAQGR